MIELRLENYYGEANVYEKDGKYFVFITDCYNESPRHEISRELYDLLIKELAAAPK